jgi:hypothetical protein
LKNIIITLLILISSSVLASDSYWEGAILEKMLLSISQKKVPVVFSQGKDLDKVIVNMKKIHFTDNCMKADFILSDEQELDKSCLKPKIVLNYRTYRNSSNAVGVFFWQKGRPTIRFSAKRLDHYGLVARGELSKFVTPNN